MDDFERRYRYLWPQEDLSESPHWTLDPTRRAYERTMPERPEDLAADSRWPAFFPSPICFVTTHDDDGVALEKVVGASIVNRFPYVVALSFCTEALSERHHVRRAFTDVLERGGSVAVQYLPPGETTDRVMAAIASVPEEATRDRILRTGLSTRPARTNAAAVFDDAYLVYEATLVKHGTDFEGAPIYDTPWIDVGSHRVYFLEITAIQLREDVAKGDSQILWRSLPSWTPATSQAPRLAADRAPVADRYQKGYTPNYAFPSAGTIAFEPDEWGDGMAIKYLPPLPQDQVEVDNDRARWPCFFPSSAGMITTWAAPGVPNLMPCGSTTVISRHPMTIAPCVSYAAINERYAPRATLEIIRATGRFGCGVPFVDDDVVDGIKYAGNTSLAADPEKIRNAGLQFEPAEWAPVLSGLPVHFDCEVVGEVRLGTHVMFLGEVRRVLVRSDVTVANPLEWLPWANVRSTD
jgi:flavin reductase (DIM6/NTAB) family NADH-FMN oxidoreductase RutF